MTDPHDRPYTFGWHGEVLRREDGFHRACCHRQTVHDESVPDPDGSERLLDHFSATVELRIAEIQPQYGLVQLNATRHACGCLVSCDVKRDEFLAAVARVLNVTVADDRDLAERDRAIAEAAWDEGYGNGVADAHTSMDWTDGQASPTRANPCRKDADQ